MLSGMEIAIIGGDLRQIEVIRKLSALDATLHLIGFNNVDDGFLEAEKKEFGTTNPESLDAVILPVSGMDTNNEVESIFSGNPLVLERDWVKKTSSNTRFYTGVANKTLKSLISEENRELIEVMTRDDLAIYNSIPTAEGTIMLVIQHTNVTIHKANVTVVGFGRVGQTIANKFHGLGANVTVVAEEEALLARAYEMNVNPKPLDELSNVVCHADVVINTIPSLIITSHVISQMPSHVFIIDLASKPGGTDFEFAKKRSIKAMLAPGLPGLVAPKTAGLQLAQLLSVLLKDQWIELTEGRT
ncbi:dipicolinic acid synthetase subunit A [Salipaludibacillus neizhouensis]|uniref:Dipicolinic acid synthetase subunit A n=1 Tax=Salipaludibacillus neizhouensis TaxID=885475 RepID=A0A3A9KX71_9BACI|nr:dipicolinic acid synthetase subunit A [Salipaludibacillus neizhouensis]RKL69046.1 dipicolinic acid synthetase subunit A [Salipaludibacillus neizhouensis]